MMKQLFVSSLSLTLIIGLATHAKAQSASASYNSATGEIVFDIGDSIGVVGLASFNGQIIQGQTPDAGSALPVQYDADNLAYFSATGLPAGVFSQGNVLPSGLSQTNIDQDFGFSYTPIGNTTTVAPITYIGDVIPEPASMALLGLGSIAFVGLRRRT